MLHRSTDREDWSSCGSTRSAFRGRTARPRRVCIRTATRASATVGWPSSSWAAARGRAGSARGTSQCRCYRKLRCSGRPSCPCASACLLGRPRSSRTRRTLRQTACSASRAPGTRRPH
eukprot:289191_1